MHDAAIWTTCAAVSLQLVAVVFYAGKLIGKIDGLTRELNGILRRLDRLESMVMGGRR